MFHFDSLPASQELGSVLAAATICAFSALLLVRLMRQSELAPASTRRWWMLGTATIAGIGVWTTHFVAMLGYRTDLVLHYHLATTLASAALAVTVVGVPLALSTAWTGPWPRLIGTATAGLGIGAMHITGMAALEGCGRTQTIGADILACLVGAACMAMARALPPRANPPPVAGLLMVAAVCGTHFLAIAGTVLTGDRSDQFPPGMPAAVGALAAAGATIILLGTFLAMAAAKRFEAQGRVLATALQNMTNGILKVSAVEVVEFYNERLHEMLNLAPGSLARGMSLRAFLERVGDANGWDQDRVVRALAHHRTWMARRGETCVEHAFDDGRILSVTCQPVEDGAVLTFEDITKAKRAEREISQLANHDPLTGLANRRSLIERMAQNFEVRHAFALLLLDLDRFNAINDTFGHGVGDRLLIGVAKRLKDLVGEAGFVARLGGDEMAVIARGGARVALRLARQLIVAIEEPHAFDDLTVVVGCSIGVCGTEDGSNPEELMQRADIALHEAKRHGRARAECYTAGMVEAVAERHCLENDIRLALAEGQFHLAYQPIMALADDGIVGYEALIRWNHPTRGFVSPATFIPLAEETGLIVAIGRWVLDEACRQAIGWPAPQHVAVNVSAAQFRSPTLLADIAASLAGSGLPAHRLEIELTETALVEDGPQIAHALAALRRLGIKVAMDDFGTGCSSLAHLRDLPLDRVKIDRSFVSAVLTDKHSLAVVRAITQMGRDMGIPTIAEGVETPEQLTLLRTLGCDAVQGYLIGRLERPGPRPPALTGTLAA